MRKWLFLSCLIVSIMCLVGCGGGGDSGSSSGGGIVSITGEWIGSFVATEIADPSHTFTFAITADLVQTGSVVTGTFTISEIMPATTGVFSSTTRAGDSLGGIMDDGGFAWSTVAVFNGTVVGSTITITGTVDWPGLYFPTDEISFVATMNLSV